MALHRLRSKPVSQTFTFSTSKKASGYPTRNTPRDWPKRWGSSIRTCSGRAVLVFRQHSKNRPPRAYIRIFQGSKQIGPQQPFVDADGNPYTDPIAAELAFARLKTALEYGTDPASIGRTLTDWRDAYLSDPEHDKAPKTMKSEAPAAGLFPGSKPRSRTN